MHPAPRSDKSFIRVREIGLGSQWRAATAPSRSRRRTPSPRAGHAPRPGSSLHSCRRGVRTRSSIGASCSPPGQLPSRPHQARGPSPPIGNSLGDHDRHRGGRWPSVCRRGHHRRQPRRLECEFTANARAVLRDVDDAPRVPRAAAHSVQSIPHECPAKARWDDATQGKTSKSRPL
jgi:hypothetical protein